MSKVKIQGHASGTGVLTVTAPNTSTDSTITLPDATGTLLTSTVRTATNEEDAILIEQSDGEDIGSLRINNGSFIIKGKHTSNPVQIQTHDGNEDIEVDPDGFIKFETGGSERMRIDSSGNTIVGLLTVLNTVGDSSKYTIGRNSTNGWCEFIGTQSGDVNYHFKGTSSSDGYVTVGNVYSSTGANGSFQRFTGAGGISQFGVSGTNNLQQIQFFNGNGSVGGIWTNGSATAYNTSSDYRLKENVVPMTGSIDRLKELNPSRFNFIADADTTVDGFLAHEAAEVVPEAITGEKDAMRTEEYEVTPAVKDDDGNVVTEAVMGEREVPDMQGIDQAKLVPLLTSALQEAVEKIEALEARVTQLENN